MDRQGNSVVAAPQPRALCRAPMREVTLHASGHYQKRLASLLGTSAERIVIVATLMARTTAPMLEAALLEHTAPHKGNAASGDTPGGGSKRQRSGRAEAGAWAIVTTGAAPRYHNGGSSQQSNGKVALGKRGADGAPRGSDSGLHACIKQAKRAGVAYVGLPPDGKEAPPNFRCAASCALSRRLIVLTWRVRGILHLNGQV
jgi:hypothetical protein